MGHIAAKGSIWLAALVLRLTSRAALWAGVEFGAFGGREARGMGEENDIKLPKPGTNPRGVEISTNALRTLAQQPQSRRIPVQCVRKEMQYDPDNRWLKLWEQD
jgi:hypothetical protein